jgi:hypothetical protein
LAWSHRLPFSRRAVWCILPDASRNIEPGTFVLIADDLRGILVFVVAIVSGGSMKHLALLEPFRMIKVRDVFIAGTLHG